MNMDHQISDQLEKTSLNGSQTTVNETEVNGAEVKRSSPIERCPPELRLKIYRELLHVTLHQEPEEYTKVKPFHLEVLWMNKKIRTEALHFSKLLIHGFVLLYTLHPVDIQHLIST